MMKVITKLYPFKNINFNVKRFIINKVENKININNCTINYLKVGSGNHSVLCLPGSVGSIWTDFKHQINGFNLDKYTLVVWDPPGYGYSRPPERDFTPNYLDRDADVAAELMNRLNINNYSILGWSDGGITGLFMASRYQANVNKLVIWGSNAYITEEDLVFYERIRDTRNWSPAVREPLENIYGVEKLREMMNKWVDSIIVFLNEYNGDICCKEVSKIKTPTFILHGFKDPLLPYFHVEYLQEHIKNSQIYVFKDGKHNIHIKYAEDFNKLVQSFLEEGSKL